ncbi:MAG: hypothetical protein L3J41_07160 [Melioribacteraceae bacterium]|nr:hypothetical protein [Melioribacteraceae bacterium]
MLNVKYYNFRIRKKLQYYVGVFLFAAISIIFTSCSSNKYSQSEIDMYLTRERVKAKTSPISFRIPQGWRVVDANNEAFIDLWILRNDMNVSLSLLPLHSNSTSQALIKSYNASVLLLQAKHKNSIKIMNEEPLQLNNSKVLFYNYKINEKEYRIAIFKHNQKFYELTLYGNNANIKIEYFIQELLISSAK